MKLSNSYILTLLGLVMTFVLAWNNKPVPEALYWLVVGYVGMRAGQKTGAVFAASRDPNADTHAIIRDIEGKAK